MICCSPTTFQDTLSNCNDAIILNALLTPGQSYKWVITNKFGQKYSGLASADVYENTLTIQIDDPDTIPPGMINTYGGVFSLQLFDPEDDCNPISFKMKKGKLTKAYSEVFFETFRGTLVKDTLGCEL